MLVAGALGLGALWQRVRRRSATAELETDPAAELREKLAQAKVVVEPLGEHPGGEESATVQPVAVVEKPDAAALDPATRRRSVHDRARNAIDELR